ncbi:pre-toxin TG domain-containing protein, partial [Bacillus haynesii]
FGYDLATGEIVKGSGDRLMAALNVTPFGKAFKYGKRGFKLFKGEEAGKKVAKVDKGTKAAKDVGKVERKTSKTTNDVLKNPIESKFKGSGDLDKLYKSVSLGKGTTGRTKPNNLNEQLAMKEVLSNPNTGKPIPLRKGMTDSRWPKDEGWVKMSKNVNGVEVHYLKNTKTGQFDDFKFK